MAFLISIPTVAVLDDQQILSGDLCTFRPTYPCENCTYHWDASAGTPLYSQSKIFEWTAPTVYSPETVLVNLSQRNIYGCADQDEMEVVVYPRTSLDIHKSLVNPQAEIKVGDILTYKIVIDNNGQTRIVTLPLLDDYPEDVMRPIDSDPAWDEVDGSTLHWNDLIAEPLDPGEKITVMVRFRAISATPLSVINLAEIKGAKDEMNNLLPPFGEEEIITGVVGVLSCQDLGPDRICDGETAFFKSTSKLDTYEWKAFDDREAEVGGFNDTGKAAVIWHPPGPGDYNITVEMRYYNEILSCHPTIEVLQTPSCKITGDEKVCNDTLVTLTAVADLDSSYRWSASGGMLYAYDSPVVAWRSPDEPGDYIINVTVTSSETGCFRTFSHNITVEACTSGINIFKDCIYEEPTHVGDTVTYTYTVSKNGDLPLKEIKVTDIQDWGPACDPLFEGGDSNENGALDPGESWIYECRYQVPNPEDYELLSIMTHGAGMMLLIQKLSKLKTRLDIKMNQLIEMRERFNVNETDLVTDYRIIDGVNYALYNYTNTITGETLSLMMDENYVVIRSEYYDPLSDVVLTTEYNPSGNLLSHTYLSRRTMESLKAEYNTPALGRTTWTTTDYTTGHSLITITDMEGNVIGMEYKKTPGYVPFEKRLWLHNTATVTATDPRGDTVSDSDVYSLEINIPLPGLSITKSADPDPVEAGGDLTYSIHYQNSGDADAHDVVIMETYDQNVTFVSSDPDPDIGTENRWTIGDLARNVSGSITVVVKVNSSLASGIMLQNTANISCRENMTAAAVINTSVVTPELNITKLDLPDPVEAGELLNYTITYRNSGDGVAHDVVIKEIYDDHVVFNSSDPAPDTGTLDQWTVGNLSADQEGEITISVQVPLDTKNGTVINNTATITCLEGITDEVSINTTVGAVVLTIDKVASSDLVTPGSSFNYTITLKNEGIADATNVVVTDIIDPNLVPNGTYLWNYPVLHPGDTEIIEIKVKVVNVTEDDSSSNVLVNRYKVDCNQTEGTFKTLETLVVHSLWITKTAENPSYSAGDYVTFNITYGNAFNRTAHNVTIVDHLPDVEYVNATPAPNHVIGNVLIWDDAPALPGKTLAPNESGTILLVVKIPKRLNISYDERSSVSGEGFVSVGKWLTTSREGYRLINYVNITGWYYSISLNGNWIKSQASDTAAITVREVVGTTINTFEHGSGYYEEDQLVKYNTSNRSILLEKDIFAQHRPTTLSLPRNRKVNYSSTWFDRTCANNYVRGEAVSENYLYMDNIDKDSSFLVDENQTTYTSFAEFSQGKASIDYFKRDPETGETLMELSEDYHGSFRAEESLDSYGSGVTSTKYVRGGGFASVDKRVGETQRSYEYGSGSYESEEMVKTGSVFKDVKMYYNPNNQTAGSFEVNYTTRWYEGMGIKDNKSVISESISSASYINKETEMASTSMALFGEFEGRADIRVVEQVGAHEDERINIDQTFQGRYTIDTSIAIHKTPKYLAPHVNVTKKAEEEGNDRVLFTINVTNDGNKPLGPVYITDTLPESMAFINSSLRPEINGQKLTWEIPSLPIGSMQTIEVLAGLEREMGTNMVNVTAHYEDGVVEAGCTCNVATDWLSQYIEQVPLKEALSENVSVSFKEWAPPDWNLTPYDVDCYDLICDYYDGLE